MIYFLKSFFYFLFSRNNYIDVVFYYPHHFNRGFEEENIFFNHLYNSCRNNNISYVVFEEPDYYSNQNRNAKAVPFDFIYVLIIILRKFIKSDKKIARILSLTILKGYRFKNCIVLSQSMTSIFRGLNSQANIYDLQHGIIYSEKSSYILNGEVSIKIKENNIKLLLFGDKFKNILDTSDSSGYLIGNSYVIGVNRIDSSILHRRFNNNILVTLQFTNDHTNQQNNNLLMELIEFIKLNREYNFYLRNHPRFNNAFNINPLFIFDNVYVSNDLLFESFKLCSLHLTAYSSTTFEASYFGIPTLFLKSLSKEYNMFFKDFDYVLDNDIKHIIANYNECSNMVKRWESLFYSDYNEQKFLSLLK